MKWHRIKTEADLPPMDERVLLHKYDRELCFEWVDIGSYQGLIRNNNGGYSYLWDIDFNNANDFGYTESDDLSMYDHWAEIEMPPRVVLDERGVVSVEIE